MADAAVFNPSSEHPSGAAYAGSEWAAASLARLERAPPTHQARLARDVLALMGLSERMRLMLQASGCGTPAVGAASTGSDASTSSGSDGSPPDTSPGDAQRPPPACGCARSASPPAAPECGAASGGSSGSGGGSAASSASRCCCWCGGADDADSAASAGAPPPPPPPLPQPAPAVNAPASGAPAGGKRTRRSFEEMPPPAPRPRAAPPAAFAHTPLAALPPPPPAAEAVSRMLHDGNRDASPSPAARLAAAAPPPPLALAQWRGRLAHQRGHSVADVAELTVQLPAAFLDLLPRRLVAPALAPRTSVPLGRHVVCRCSLPAEGGGGARGGAALAAMAGGALVAVVPLPLCELVVVPYTDSAARVRVVAFLRV